MSSPVVALWLLHFPDYLVDGTHYKSEIARCDSYQIIPLLRILSIR